ncbi:MAG: serpin family protein [Flavobacteriia bacterium]|nr:MAG: serpin family protein [Flavobacteriia bacterium]
MKTAKLILLFVLMVNFYSCTESQEVPQEYISIKLDLKSQEIVYSSNDFGINLFRQVASVEEGKNLMISSLSVSQALGMTWNGARGTTRDEMTEVMGFSVDKDEDLNTSNKTIRDALLSADNMVEMDIANSIWYRNTFRVKNEFVGINKKYYDAEVKGLDFDDSEGSKKAINGWVKKKTKDKITEVVQEINPDDVMFLINAVYFKGKWKYQFKKEDTSDEPFLYADGHRADVKMMSQNEHLEYFEANACSGVALPYGNGHFRMIVLLPDEDVTLKDFVADLNESDLSSHVNSAMEAEVNLKLPKFTFECDLRLNYPLQQLGIKTAFTDHANLSGIGDPSNLTISKVQHKTFVEVNEEGTEAAAVTSVTVGVTSVGPEESVSFVVDRPFLFLIQEKDTEAILFIGQVYDPR